MSELESLIAAKRSELGIASTESKSISQLMEERPVDEYRESLKSIQPIPQDPRQGLWRELVESRGKRYEGCRIGNFGAKHDSQKKAVERLAEFASKMPSMIQEGRGVLLFGSKGTGKDHLAMGLAHAAVAASKRVHWINGADMRGDVRDSTKMEDLERDYVSKLLRPDVLWISDPLPVSGVLTDAQQDRLFRVLDARYSRLKPTWVTVNVSNREELELRLGPQNADRLRDGSLAVFCDWPSYRETLK